jgi:hypothetical protein
MPRRLAGHQGNPALRQAAQLGEKRAAGSVGGTVDRRRGQADFQLIALDADYLIAAGARLHINEQLDAG